MTWRTSFRRFAISATMLAGLPLQGAGPARGSVEYVRTIPSVREFTKSHSIFVRVFDWLVGPGDGKPEILRPFATTRDSLGRLFVADPGQHGVHVYDFEKHKYMFLRGARRNEMISPLDLACDSADNLYVTDSVRARIFVFDSKGKLRRTIGGGAGQEPQFQRPTGMAMDRRAQRLYVADTLRHQVVVLGFDGKQTAVIGKRGIGPGEFNFPVSLTLASDKLYVVDSMNFRIQSFTTDGKFVTTFGQMGNQTGTLNRPKGVAVDTDGDIYVVDALFETVQIFNPQGQLLYYFGSSGTNSGQFQLPSGISIDDRNMIYVADSYNRRVQVFRYRRLE
jgi:DNA-binding beta-propeller fold protein YncE